MIEQNTFSTTEIQTPVSPQPVPALPPQKTVVLPVLMAVLITSLLFVGGFFGYQYFQGKKPVAVTLPAQTNLSPSTSPLESETDMKTYKNDELGFSFQYPQSFVVTDTLQKTLKEIPTTHNSLMLEDKDTKQQFTFMINPDGFGPFFPDKTLAIAYSDEKGIYSTKTEDTENQENSDPKTYSIVITGKINNDTTFIGFANAPRGAQSQKDLVELTNRILSSFEFNKKLVSSSPVPALPKIAIVDTSNWKSASSRGVTFKIPSNATCTDEADCKEFTWPNIYQGKEMPLPAKLWVTVKDYEGGSRREQYTKIVPSINECRPKYVEAQFGTVNALQIAIDGGWCQGGYGGNIVAVVGNKFVMVGTGLTYGEDGKINRWDIQDTVVSTLRETK